MYCAKCGKEFEGNSEICPECKASYASYRANGAFESPETKFITDCERKAKIINILGIVSIIASALCYTGPGIACAIISLVMGSSFSKLDGANLPDDIKARFDAAQATVKRAKIFAIVGIVVAAVMNILGFIVGLGIGFALDMAGGFYPTYYY